jgi:hypothetical protein
MANAYENLGESALQAIALQKALEFEPDDASTLFSAAYSQSEAKLFGLCVDNYRTLLRFADLVIRLKTASSKWLKTQSRDLENFSSQRGYGCFSVGPTDLDAVIQYIDNQEEHHKTRTFQEEFRILLDKYGIEYNEEYVWD